jgi:predicted transcriptional regulator
MNETIPETIRIDPDVWLALQGLAKPFVETPNDVLRRVLGLGARSGDDPWGSKMGTTKAEVNKILIRSSGPVTKRQIEKATGLRDKQVRYKHFEELERRGFLTREKQGREYKYAVTEKGRMVYAAGHMQGVR